MKKILLSSKFVVPTIGIAILYSIAITYAMNAQLIIDTLVGSFSLQYKITILFVLLQGMWTAMNGFGIVILCLTAILTGANLTFLWQNAKAMKGVKNLHFVVGGNSLLGVFASGCAACGLPILSLLGISGSILYLPLHGVELSYLAVILLSISFFLLIRSNQQKQLCLVPAK
jgi:hypothetical protein